MSSELTPDATGAVPAAPAQSLVVTVAEAAEMLRLDPRTIRELFRRGELAGNQCGHAIRLSREGIVRWSSGKRCVPHSGRKP